MKRILTVITMAILTLTAIGTAEARQQTDSRNSLAGKVSDAATSAPIEFADTKTRSSESIRPTAQTSGQSASNLTLRCWTL